MVDTLSGEGFVDPDAPLPPSSARRRKRRREPNAVFAVAGRVAYLPLLALSSYEVRGAEKLPETGAFVLAPNHYSNFDPLANAFVLWRLGRIPRFLAKASLFKAPVLGWILKHTAQIPVVRSGHHRGADPVAAGVATLATGAGVIVYPEGSLTREPDLWPMRGKAGAVRMALEAGVPLIPAASWGIQEILPASTNRFSVFPRKRLVFAFGDPVDLSAYRGRHVDGHEVAEATELVMRRIESLLAEIRGGTPPSVRYDPAHHNQSEIGRFERDS